MNSSPAKCSVDDGVWPAATAATAAAAVIVADGDADGAAAAELEEEEFEGQDVAQTAAAERKSAEKEFPAESQKLKMSFRLKANFTSLKKFINLKNIFLNLILSGTKQGEKSHN